MSDREMRRRANALVSKKMDQLMRGAMLEGLKQIMERTPVDKGRARGNWNTSKNRPDGSVDMDAGSPGNQGQVDAVKLSEGASVIGSVRFFDGDVGYIVNGVPYIKPLEDGSSTQAPNGMVGLTVENLKPWLQRQAERIRRGI